MDFSLKLPRFVPHWLLRNGHFQTLAALYQSGGQEPPDCAGRHLVDVSGGDQVVLHDDCPGRWNPGDQVALMIHESPGNLHAAGRLAAEPAGHSHIPHGHAFVWGRNESGPASLSQRAV